MTDQGLSIFDEEPGEDVTPSADEDATQVMPAVPAEKPEQPEPYLCLSYIFYIFKDDKHALYYLKAAEKTAPDFPECSRLRKLYVRTFSRPAAGTTINRDKVNGLLTSFKNK